MALCLAMAAHIAFIHFSTCILRVKDRAPCNSVPMTAFQLLPGFLKISDLEVAALQGFFGALADMHRA